MAVGVQRQIQSPRGRIGILGNRGSAIRLDFLHPAHRGDARFRKYHVRSGWKPVIAAYRPPIEVSWDWFKDVASGGKEKADHPWRQAVDESAHFIRHPCPKKGLVFDPCCGSGTALLVKMAPATVAREVKRARQFFKAAVRRKLIRENPFAEVKGGNQENRNRFYFVTREEADRVLAACPTAEWKFILGAEEPGCHRSLIRCRRTSPLWPMSNTNLRHT